MPLGFRWALRSDVGTVRTNNEDSAYASPRLLVLADGMGGHAGGEVASVVATNRFARIDPGAGDVPAQVTEAGRETRAALHAMSVADPALETMGTTAIALACDGTDLLAGHIGDSRLYLLRGDELFQVTTDHTHVQYLVDSGQIHPDQVARHPYRAMLLRSLDDQPGGSDLDLIDVEAVPGDRFLLCSDGLSDYVDVSVIGAGLATGTPDDAATALLEAALAAGTRDNVTVIVADLTDEPVDDAAAAGGAAAEPLVLSPSAADALGEVMPQLLSGPREDSVAPPDEDVETPARAETPADDGIDDEVDEHGGEVDDEAGEVDGPNEPADAGDPSHPGDRDDSPLDPEPANLAATSDPELARPEPTVPVDPVEPSDPQPEPITPIAPITAEAPPPPRPRPGVPVGGILAAIAVLVLGAAFVALL